MRGTSSRRTAAAMMVHLIAAAILPILLNYYIEHIHRKRKRQIEEEAEEWECRAIKAVETALRVGRGHGPNHDLNENVPKKVGIATAFLVGGPMATSTIGLSNYFGLMSICSTILFLGTVLQYQEEPEVAPSTSDGRSERRVEKIRPFGFRLSSFQDTGLFETIGSIYLFNCNYEHCWGIH